MVKSVGNINNGTPIIAMTAYESKDRSADEFDQVLSKPVTKDMITKVFQDLDLPLPH